MKKVDRELLFFIQSQVEIGQERELIKENLVKAGWTEDTVTDGFSAFDRGERAKSSWAGNFLWILVVLFLSFTLVILINNGRPSSSKVDMNIKQEIGNLRAQAEIIYHSQGHGNYYAVCGGGQIEQDKKTRSQLEVVSDGNGGGSIVCNVSEDGSRYAVSVALTEEFNKNKYWCVDSEGFSGTITEQLNYDEASCKR